MKRILTLLLFFAAVAAESYAQKGMNSNRLFDGRFNDDKRVAETMIQGSQLEDYGLSVYHSLTATDAPEVADEILQCVNADAANAIEREVSYRGGKLYYGFYQLPDRHGAHRYLFYLNQNLTGGNKVIVIFLQGTASRKEIKEMLK